MQIRLKTRFFTTLLVPLFQSIAVFDKGRYLFATKDDR